MNKILLSMITTFMFALPFLARADSDLPPPSMRNEICMGFEHAAFMGAGARQRFTGMMTLSEIVEKVKKSAAKNPAANGPKAAKYKEFMSMYIDYVRWGWKHWGNGKDPYEVGEAAYKRCASHLDKIAAFADS